MKSISLKVGLTPPHDCQYLPNQQEQLLVLLDETLLTPTGYEPLLSAGFRRSGSDVYRPRCATCNACQSLRLAPSQFKASRSQKRIRRLNRDVKIHVAREDKPEYFQLYERYINQRHQDGTMYPASHEQYASFVLCEWLSPLFIECWLDDNLVAVAVTDELSQALSAIYTFYEPRLSHRSLGTFAILSQIQLGIELNKHWLYLGYQVDDCQKMNYKQHFRPHQRFIAGQWQEMNN